MIVICDYCDYLFVNYVYLSRS